MRSPPSETLSPSKVRPDLTWHAGRAATGGIHTQALSSSRRGTSLRRTEAFTDALTGLGNRRAFDRDPAAALVDRRAHGLLLAMVDVDGLKTVNDTLGHPVGDRVLQVIAAALRSHVRTEDRVYRLGGDEFAALSTSRDPEALETRLGRQIEATVPGVGCRRASVGVGRAQPGMSR